MNPHPTPQDGGKQDVESIANKYAAALEASWNEFYKDHRNPVPGHATYSAAIKKAIEVSIAGMRARVAELEGALRLARPILETTSDMIPHEEILAARDAVVSALSSSK